MKNENLQSENEFCDTIFQEHKDAGKEKIRKAGSDNRSKKTGKDARDHASIIIVFRVSDWRRRDLDGMVATVLDCAVHAGIIKDDSLGYIDRFIVGYIKVPKGDEGFDMIFEERNPKWLKCLDWFRNVFLKFCESKSTNLMQNFK